MKKTILLTSSLLLVLSSCNNISKKEYDELLKENESLKSEIHDLKYGPETKMRQIQQYIDEDNPINAKIAIEDLISDYPESSEAISARKMLTDINKQVEILNAKKEKENADRVKKATNNLRTEKDDFEGITWYYAKTTPQYTNRNNIYCYFGKRDNGTPWLRLRIQYTASDWLFIESYSIKTDNRTYDITTNYGDVKNDHSGGERWEWIDKTPTATEYIMLRDIANSKNATIRHNGRQYSKDRTISTAEKKALNDLLDSFEALGGIKPKYN